MSLFKKRPTGESEQSGKPQSLAVAYEVSRKTKRAGTRPQAPQAPVMDAPMERSASIADAILQKRKAMALAEGGEVEPADDDMEADLKENTEDSELGCMDDDAPMSMTDKIRAKLKAQQGF